MSSPIFYRITENILETIFLLSPTTPGFISEVHYLEVILAELHKLIIFKPKSRGVISNLCIELQKLF